MLPRRLTTIFCDLYNALEDTLSLKSSLWSGTFEVGNNSRILKNGKKLNYENLLLHIIKISLRMQVSNYTSRKLRWQHVVGVAMPLQGYFQKMDGLPRPTESLLSFLTSTRAISCANFEVEGLLFGRHSLSYIIIIAINEVK